MEDIILYTLILLLTIFQSIIGVGILVLGTPILLLVNFDIIDIISILLPISILTSFINLIFIKKDNNLLKKDNIKKIFFIFCLPGILIGTFLLKNFQNYFNFNLLIGVFVIISVIIKIKFSKNLYKFLSEKNKKILLSFLGILQGITNSGGTLLSLLVTSFNNDEKDLSRYQITYLYFFIALTQYVFVHFLFKDLYIFKYYWIIIVLLGVFIGNILVRFINKMMFMYLVYGLSLLSAIFLLFKNFFF